MTDSEMAQHAHNHAIGVPAHLNDLQAGQDKNSTEFQALYNIQVTDWYINCAACCWTYLTQTRNYTTAQGANNHVRFGQVRDNLVRCYISPNTPQNTHGQFKTEQLGNPVLGGPLVRQYSTFRFYKDQISPEQIAIGVPTKVYARIESIAIPAVEDKKIIGSQLCYNHAALCELFRERRTPPLNRLNGVCVTVVPQPVFKSVKVKTEDKDDGTKGSPIKVKREDREDKDDVEKLTESVEKLHGTSLINQES